jgi:drug/metabolite transporter (DMT)-like permease
VIGAAFGLLTALLIGLGDLFGRRVSIRSSPITSATAMQGFGAVTVAISLLIWRGRPEYRDLALGAASGLGFATGLCCYYFGLKNTTSAVVAPVTAVIATCVPFIWVLAIGQGVSQLASIGVVVALAGLVMVTTDGEVAGNIKSGVLWGLVSGLGYGFGVTVLLNVTANGGTWVLTSQRLLAFAVMVPVAMTARASITPPSGTRLAALVAGVFAGSASITCFLGLQFDPLATVVAMSLFPVFSVLVGVSVYNDHASARQAWGIAVAVIGTAAVVGG